MKNLPKTRNHQKISAPSKPSLRLHCCHSEQKQKKNPVRNLLIRHCTKRSLAWPAKLLKNSYKLQSFGFKRSGLVPPRDDKWGGMKKILNALVEAGGIEPQNQDDESGCWATNTAPAYQDARKISNKKRLTRKTVQSIMNAVDESGCNLPLHRYRTPKFPFWGFWFTISNRVK